MPFQSSERANSVMPVGRSFVVGGDHLGVSLGGDALREPFVVFFRDIEGMRLRIAWIQLDSPGKFTLPFEAQAMRVAAERHFIVA